MEGNLYVEIKKCWMCKKYKSLTSFYKCKKYGRQKKCIECEKKYKQDHIEHIKKIQKNLTIKNKEKKRDYDKIYRIKNKIKIHAQIRNLRLKSNYNISYDQKLQLLNSQNNTCKICNCVLDITNQIRGIICRHCNTSIGQFKDNVEIIQNAIIYLNQTKNNKISDLQFTDTNMYDFNLATGYKKCSACFKIKTCNAFNINHSRCKRCYNLWRCHKITELHYDYLLEQQDRKCACCKISYIDAEVNHKSILNVDHNHQTMKIRGLLCSRCNTGIGLAKDNIIILYSMIEYLKLNNHIRR